MLAGIAVTPCAPDPRPPAPTAPSVHLIAGRSTSFPAWPVRMPTLSACDIATSRSLARADGLSDRLHQEWLPHRPCAKPGPAATSWAASANTTAANRNCARVLVTPLRPLPGDGILSPRLGSGAGSHTV